MLFGTSNSTCDLGLYRPIEIPYGDKDQKGEYTLQQGDLVEFNIATDRRDKLQRATNILLVDDTFKISSEVRETVSIESICCIPFDVA